ncbi:MAG TPA: M56 family metallopeptidase [Cellvibrio sp.]|nr:M56 family metallopeptidase [Cellvibrio sp.]
MLTWIIYVMFVSLLLGIAALAAERRAHLRRKSSRWYWMFAIIASLLIPTVIASVSIQIPAIFSQQISQDMVALKEVTSRHLSPLSWISPHTAHQNKYRGFDPFIKQIWWGLSTILLCGLVASGGYLLWRKRQWKKTSLLETPVLVSDDIGPAVVGLINPQIVIPTWVMESPLPQQRAVIAHEQSHLDAGDPLLLTLALSLLVFMPWNLPLWWQLRRLRFAIEVDCDARVLRQGQSITNYGETLIAVGQRQSGYVGSVAGMSESKSSLEKRIKIMVTKPAKWWRLSAIFFGIMSLGFVAIAAQVSPPNASESLTVTAKEITLPVNVLEKYTGFYNFMEFAVMTVTRDENRLFSQLTGQQAIEIFPESTTEFFPKVVKAQITFAIDEQGNSTALTLNQNGTTITAPRITKSEAEKIIKTISTKIENQTPSPGSEAALRGLIAGLISGNPDYTTMSAELAQATKEQFTQLHAGAKSLGEIKSIQFRGVGSQGWDVYTVFHERGSSEWRIQLSESGVIMGAFVHAAP